MREKVVQRFESMLDIRSFDSVNTNLSLLLKLLLTREQLQLLKLNKAHSVSDDKSLRNDKRVKDDESDRV